MARNKPARKQPSQKRQTKPRPNKTVQRSATTQVKHPARKGQPSATQGKQPARKGQPSATQGKQPARKGQPSATQGKQPINRPKMLQTQKHAAGKRGNLGGGGSYSKVPRQYPTTQGPTVAVGPSTVIHHQDSSVHNQANVSGEHNPVFFGQAKRPQFTFHQTPSKRQKTGPDEYSTKQQTERSDVNSDNQGGYHEDYEDDDQEYEDGDQEYEDSDQEYEDGDQEYEDDDQEYEDDDGQKYEGDNQGYGGGNQDGGKNSGNKDDKNACDRPSATEQDKSCEPTSTALINPKKEI